MEGMRNRWILGLLEIKPTDFAVESNEGFEKKSRISLAYHEDQEQRKRNC